MSAHAARTVCRTPWGTHALYCPALTSRRVASTPLARNDARDRTAVFTCHAASPRSRRAGMRDTTAHRRRAASANTSSRSRWNSSAGSTASAASSTDTTAGVGGAPSCVPDTTDWPGTALPRAWRVSLRSVRRSTAGRCSPCIGSGSSPKAVYARPSPCCGSFSDEQATSHSEHSVDAACTAV